MERFVYDQESGEENNFRRWRLMNSDERESVREAPLSEEEARVVFNRLRSNGWLTTSPDEEGQGKSASS
jgi:lauroyl/myristoyl acyltransferase